MVNYIQVFEAMKSHNSNFNHHIQELAGLKYGSFLSILPSLLLFGICTGFLYCTGGGLIGSSIMASVGGGVALTLFIVSCVQGVRLHQIQKKIFTTQDLEEWSKIDNRNYYGTSLQKSEMLKAWSGLIQKSVKKDTLALQGGL